MPITAQKRIETYHQTITPQSQGDVPDILTSLLPIARAEKVTGTISVRLRYGGVASISVERVEETNVK